MWSNQIGAPLCTVALSHVYCLFGAAESYRTGGILVKLSIEASDIGGIWHHLPLNRVMFNCPVRIYPTPTTVRLRKRSTRQKVLAKLFHGAASDDSYTTSSTPTAQFGDALDDLPQPSVTCAWSQICTVVTQARL